MKKFKLSKLVVYSGLTLWALTTIFPLLWVINNSFKGTQEIIDNSFSLPSLPFEQLFDNYKQAFERNILQGYSNSMIISGSVVVFVLIIASLASYVVARHEFKGKNLFKALVMGSMLIPIFATIVPVFEILLKFDLFNKRIGLILPQIAGNLSFAILVISSFMSTIPKELEEAAQIEGCNSWQVLWKMIIPISKPSLATTSIFVFLWSYNDLFTSLIIMRTRDKMPINVMLTDISSQYGTNYGLMSATITIIVIPVLLFYILAQKQVVEGMTSGAVKG